MKILNKDEFLKMPVGTLFMKGHPWVFDILSFKGDSLKNDFTYLSLYNVDSFNSEQFFDRLEEMLEKGTSYPADDDGFARDACFDPNDIFLVFEKDDLLKLHDRIRQAIDAVEGT